MVGNNSININSLSFDWSSANNFLGWCSNAATKQKIKDINSQIKYCGKLIEPVNNVIPAKSKVLVFTSEDFLLNNFSFANLTDTVYAIFQCTGNTGGHFVNYSSTPGTRTTILKISGKCNDTVTYERSKMVKQDLSIGSEDGATILINQNKTISYTNFACGFPVIKIDAKIMLVTTIKKCGKDSFGVIGKVTGTNCFVWRSNDGRFKDSTKINTTFYPNKNTCKIFLYAFANCTKSIDSFIIYSSLKPNANFIITPATLVKYGTAVKLIPNQTNLFHIWKINDVITTDNFVLNKIGKFKITHIITDSMGCSDTNTQWIEAIEDIKPVDIRISNVFTPNNDGINDYFEVRFTNLIRCKIIIRNRWGQKLFESKNIGEKWNGKLNNVVCPSGAYFYTISTTDINNKSETFYGTVYLISE